MGSGYLVGARSYDDLDPAVPADAPRLGAGWSAPSTGESP
jgi:hypothetical protein